MINCCYNCPDRKLGCHGYCEKYISAKESHEIIIERMREDNRLRKSLNTIKFEGRKKR
jgi:hypothetical protein